MKQFQAMRHGHFTNIESFIDVADWISQQDNASYYACKSTQKWFKTAKIYVLPWLNLFSHLLVKIFKLGQKNFSRSEFGTLIEVTNALFSFSLKKISTFIIHV